MLPLVSATVCLSSNWACATCAISNHFTCCLMQAKRALESTDVNTRQQRHVILTHSSVCKQSRCDLIRLDVLVQAAVTSCLSSLGSLCKALLAQLQASARTAVKQSLSADGPTELRPQVIPASPFCLVLACLFRLPLPLDWSSSDKLFVFCMCLYLWLAVHSLNVPVPLTGS